VVSSVNALSYPVVAVQSSDGKFVEVQQMIEEARAELKEAQDKTVGAMDDIVTMTILGTIGEIGGFESPK
jgi:hypothetical protein